jgi:hypothetical protein
VERVEATSVESQGLDRVNTMMLRGSLFGSQAPRSSPG